MVSAVRYMNAIIPSILGGGFIISISTELLPNLSLLVGSHKSLVKKSLRLVEDQDLECNNLFHSWMVAKQSCKASWQIENNLRSTYTALHPYCNILPYSVLSSLPCLSATLPWSMENIQGSRKSNFEITPQPEPQLT